MQSLSKVFKKSTFPTNRTFHKNQPKITKHNQINRLRRLESELNGTIFKMSLTIFLFPAVLPDDITKTMRCHIFFEQFHTYFNRRKRHFCSFRLGVLKKLRIIQKLFNRIIFISLEIVIRIIPQNSLSWQINQTISTLLVINYDS